jgi:hypothetical protein
MSDQTPLMTFRGHTYIKVIGDAHTPARMWRVYLYTKAEFEGRCEKKREGIVPMRESHRSLVETNFGKE